MTNRTYIVTDSMGQKHTIGQVRSVTTDDVLTILQVDDDHRAVFCDPIAVVPQLLAAVPNTLEAP